MNSRWGPRFATRLVTGIAVTVSLVLPVAAAAAEPFRFGSPGAVTKAGDLKGRIVETRDGEELGRVHDFALDLDSGRIAYLVVSVGSFLIEDSFIAVAPGALRESADADRRLVLEADAQSLRTAQRFSAGDWPVQADVLASARDATSAEPPDEGSAEAEQEGGRRGTATISSGNRTATLSAGERNMRVEERPAPPPAEQPPPAGALLQRAPPDSRFGRLDTDGNGVLNRAEIAHELTRRDNYSEIDLDDSGTIDPMEFDALMESREESAGSASSR